MSKNIAAIILAAGKGTRFKSEKPKVLHTLAGRPMLSYVLDLTKELGIKNTVCVLGYKHAEVKKVIAAESKGVKTVIQKKIDGTANAVKAALSGLKNFRGTVLLLYGDIPLLKKETIKKLLDYHIKNNVDATILTATLDKPEGYGRVVRDKLFSISSIVEEKDADDFKKEIKEINTGIICFNKDALQANINKIRPNNRKKEYYLTDIIGILYKNGKLVDGVKISDINEALGINSRVEQARANAIMHQRINEKLMKEGVTIVDPTSAFINFGTKIGADTVIYPFTVIENDVKIGKDCFIGPFVHFREGTRIGDRVLAGNFLEIVRSSLGTQTFAKHFCYLGDTKIGKKVNIGAGSVVANFDGVRKNNSEIKDRAFIGCDTVLISPVKIGKAATTGAGSVVLKNTFVPDGACVAGVPARKIKHKG